MHTISDLGCLLSYYMISLCNIHNLRSWMSFIILYDIICNIHNLRSWMSFIISYDIICNIHNLRSWKCEHSAELDR